MHKPLFTWRAGLLLALLLACPVLRAQNVNWNVIAPGHQKSVAADAAGNVWVTGEAHYAVYDSTRVYTTDTQFYYRKFLAGYANSYYLTKYNASGTVQWTKAPTAQSPREGVKVKPDAAGNAYVMGKVGKEGAKLGNQTLSLQNGETFLAKYSPSGQLLWVTQYSGVTYTWTGPRAELEVDGQGNVYILGDLQNPVRLGSITLPAKTKNGYDFRFIAKCSTSGVWQWATVLNETDPVDHRLRIAATPSGEVFVAGTFENAADFGGVLYEGESSDGFYKTGLYYAKYSTAGTLQWVKVAKGTGYFDEVDGVDADGSGNLYLAGSFRNTIRFGDVDLVDTIEGEETRSQVFRVKVDNAGSLVWAKTILAFPYKQNPWDPAPERAYVEPQHLTTDPAGNTYLVAVLNGKAVLDGETLTSPINSFTKRAEDMYFTAKYDGTGQLQWVRTNLVKHDRAYHNPVRTSSSAAGLFITQYHWAPITGYEHLNIKHYTLSKIGAPSASATNLAPSVSAGSDQTLAFRSGATNETMLTGSTRDPDGTIQSVAWAKKSGPAAKLNGVGSPTLVVSELTAGTYVFAMSATDNKNVTASNEVKVVVGSAAPVAQQVGSFSLINADTDQPVKTLVNGETINLATLPTRNLNLRANTSPATVGSVRFVLNGVAKNESIAPYAWAGDTNGNYNAWTPAPGGYTLSGTAYSGSGATGTKGGTLTIHFTVTNQAGPAISSLVLVNADTDANLRALTTGTTIDLAALPTRRINVRAYTTPGTVGSVRMVLNGTTRTENIAPYAWAGDTNGNLNPWTPSNGNYMLTVTAYSGSNGSGLAGKPVQVSFKVINGSATARLAADRPEEALLKVYPNPATDQLTLQLPEAAGPVQVQLFDPLGRLHYQAVLRGTDGKRVVNLAGLPAGLYVVRAESGGKTHRVKVRKE
jgi:hypothetical protein